MGNPQATGALLSLPPEIRDLIYSIILHPSNNRTFCPDEYAEYDYRDALALFRLSRQIHHEARAVFRALNVFVRVETPWSEAGQHVHVVGHVPILVQGERASRFRDHTLQVTIEASDDWAQHGAEGAGPHHFVMLADDLPGFTGSWFYWNLSHPGLNGLLSLRLFLRDPYHTPESECGDGENEKHVRREVQQKLLLPFGKVKDLKDFSLGGSPPPQARIAAELRALQAERPATPEQCLLECMRLKAEGNELLQRGEARAALAAYARAWEAIHIVVRGRARHVHAERFFARDLTEEPFRGKNGQLECMYLRIQLVANTCLAYLRLRDWDELRFWGMRTIRLIRQAAGADDVPIAPEDEALLGFPSAAQVGKIYYRTALAFEELGDQSEARNLLRVAQVYLPHDPIVQKKLASLSSQLAVM